MGVSELYAALIGAALGALFATLGGIVKDFKDRRARRRTLATVLLCELRSADASFRQLYDSRMGILPKGAFSMFESTSHLLDVFKPETVRLILDFSVKMNGIRELLDGALQERYPRGVQFDTLVLAQTAAAAGLVESLKTALESEGGEYIPFIPPKMPELKAGSKNPPKLFPSPFPDIQS